MTFRRQALPLHAGRSINHTNGRGLGTKQIVKPQNGLTLGRRPIMPIVRGQGMFGPAEEYKPALIGMGRRPVFARSGNEDSQHLADGEDHPWALVGDMEPAEIEANKQADVKSYAVGALAALALGILAFR
jgi:hypothetical protein